MAQKLSPSSDPKAVRARYEKWKAGGNKKPFGVFKYICDNEADKLRISTRLDLAKSLMRPLQPTAISNEDLLNCLLDNFINAKDQKTDTGNHDQTQRETYVSPGTFVGKTMKDDSIFLSSKGSIDHILELLHQHRNCNQVPEVSEVRFVGHAAMLRIKCLKCSFATGWNSSQYMTSTEGHTPMFLVNMKMAHAYITSGLRKVQYETFCNGAGIGTLKDEKINKVKKIYMPIIQESADSSKQQALEEEIASTENVMSGIDIMTDARHGTRKNSKDTDVICLGEQTHKCLWS